MLPIEVRPELTEYDLHVLRACGVRVDEPEPPVDQESEVERVIKFGTVHYLFFVAGLGFLMLTLVALLVLAMFKVIR